MYTYKRLLKLKIGEQTVILFNENDREKYNTRFSSGAWNRALHLVRMAERKTEYRFMTEKGAMGLLITRVEDKILCLTDDMRDDLRHIIAYAHTMSITEKGAEILKIKVLKFNNKHRLLQVEDLIY